MSDLTLPAPPLARPPAAHRVAATTETLWVKAILIGVTLLFLGLFLLFPLVVVFTEALRRGIAAYFASLADPDAVAAIWLTLVVAAIAVPANLVFGIAAAWAIAKYEFRGKAFLTTL